MKKLGALLIVISLVLAAAGMGAAQEPPPQLSLDGDANLVRVPGTEGVGTLWENGEWDGVNGLSSEDNVGGWQSRTADDFYLDPACPLYNVTTIRGQHITYAHDALVEIYEDAGGVPGAMIWSMLGATSWADIGDAFGYDVIEYTFDTPGLQLPAGNYWISVAGLNNPYAQSFWATAQPGWGSQVYFKSDYFGFPDWTPGNVVFGVEYDAAFDMDGECAQADYVFATHVRILPLPGPGLLLGIVRAATGNGSTPVAGATVDVTWTIPPGGGYVIPQTRTTNASGLAFPVMLDNWPGTVLDLVNITAAGYTYDPGLNWEDSATWP